MNIASRMESTAQRRHVQFTERTLAEAGLRAGAPGLEVRELDIKGKGLTKTYQIDPFATGEGSCETLLGEWVDSGSAGAGGGAGAGGTPGIATPAGE
jgi:hypothetical protein